MKCDISLKENLSVNKCIISKLSGQSEIQITQVYVVQVDKVLVDMVTSCFRLDGLDNVIDSFQNAVIDLVVTPAEYAIPMVYDGQADLMVDSRSGDLLSNPDLPEGSTLAAILIIKNVLDVQLDCQIAKDFPFSFKSIDHASRVPLNFVWQVSVVW